MILFIIHGIESSIINNDEDFTDTSDMLENVGDMS